MERKINTFGKIENKVYKEMFIPYTYNCDAHANARLDWIFEIVQEAAASHSSILNCSIFDLNESGLTWVISRENIEVYKYPKWREEVFVETWAEKPYRRVLVPRIIQGKNADGEILFRSVTLWPIIDLKTNRPIEPTAMLEKIGIPEQTKQVDFQIKKRDVIDDTNPLISKIVPRINYSDTDFNKHVNNISYIRWTLQSMPNDFRDKYITTNIDVSWLKQTYLKDDVEIITRSESPNAINEDNPTFIHQLIRVDENGDKKTVFEAKTCWEKRA